MASNCEASITGACCLRLSTRESMLDRCLSSRPAQHISSSIHPRLARLVLGVTNCSAWLKGKPQTAATHTNTHAHASMAFNHTHTCTWGLVGTSNVSLHHAGSRFRRIPRGKVEAKHAPPRSQRTRLHTSMRVRAARKLLLHQNSFSSLAECC